MERIRRLASWGLAFVAAAAALAGLVVVVGWLFRPNVSRTAPAPEADDLRAVTESRRTPMDVKNPPVLYREVDYLQGPAGKWYPKGESPLLAELVQNGRLESVAKRTGEEPLVWQGCEGIGKYGGTWLSGSGQGDLWNMQFRFSATTLVKWSPQGYPIVPHVAKRWEVSKGPNGKPDYRTYTFWLRKGMRWSDGHPFTADDIMYWWEHEASDTTLYASLPPFMLINGQAGKVEKVDDHCVRFVFPLPHGLFLDLIATANGVAICGAPRHYLEPYHPVVGDQALIARTLQARHLPSAKSMYLEQLKRAENPEHPRLWPWVYRTFSSNPPFEVVRNPYYWIVDIEGNQLPYIDSWHIEDRSGTMAISNPGQDTFSVGQQSGEEYSLVMSQRQRGGYNVTHWYRADRAWDTVSINLNLKTDYDDPDKRREAKNKWALLRDKRFRQALSLALNRKEIIQANYNGLTEPAQVGPGRESYFFNPRLFKSYTDFDPARANRLLDELGLTQRDYEGYRTFADGTRMTFILNYCTWYRPYASTAEFMTEHWGKVGVRVVPRMIDNNLYYVEKGALRHEMSIFPGDGEHEPCIGPRTHVAFCAESNWALAYAQWWMLGGLWGNLKGKPLPPGCIEPETDSEPGRSVRRGMELYGQILATGDRARQKELYDQIQDIAAENLWTVSVCTMPPMTTVSGKGLRNVPAVGVYTFNFMAPGNAGLETFYFDQPDVIRGMKEHVQAGILAVTPQPESLAATESASANGKTARVVRYLIWAVLGAMVLLIALRHPYIGRRLLIMVPTLTVISVVVFFIIQLPPGDFLTSKIMALRATGDQVSETEIQNLRQAYDLDKPMVVRYARWMGLAWFTSFDGKDEGLLQGNLGRSMNDGRLVNQIMGDRILMSFIISLGTILLTWLIAVPIGIYSAVRQYSWGDYVTSFLGFVGMCVPSFLLALVLMYASRELFSTNVTGLFSPRYGAQPNWDVPKALDLLKHLWVPVVILGFSSTAGMIRVMRANLLDELKKPYVTTARAKGVRPLRLLLKYPVRMALNPFISGIGGLFPYLISGGTVVAVVLSLPTVDPLMLNALMLQDMYLAGSMLLVLSLLGVLGVLVSDLLLLWLDPRIRFQGGTR